MGEKPGWLWVKSSPGSPAGVPRLGPSLEVLPLWLRGGDTCLFQSSQVMPQEPVSPVCLSHLLGPTIQGILDLLGLHEGAAAKT